MKFIRNQEERFALKLLVWRYQKLGIPLPPLSQLEKEAAGIVTEAHQIARKRGQNILAIVKDLVRNLRRESPDSRQDG